MEPITVKIIFKSKDMEITREFSNSLYAQLKPGEEIELDIQGNIINCVVTRIWWDFNFFGNYVNIKVIPANESGNNNSGGEWVSSVKL